MGGVLIAFKNYRFDLGIIRSPWAGFANFQFIFGNQRFFTLIRLTVLYNVVFMITGLIATVGLALLLSEMLNKYYKKVSHSLIFLPYFVSWVVVSFISWGLFNNQFGMLPAMLASWGIDFNFYATPWIWPFILVFMSIWKGIGYGSVIYLAVITGVDPEMHESAKIDGASVWQRMGYISLPMLKPTIILLTVMGLSGILAGGADMFFQIIGNNIMLHRVADTIDAYILRSLLQPGAAMRFEQTAALGLFQQFVGFTLIITVNGIIKKTSPEHAIF
jgi:putative aldouronate transport system permease protein